MNDHQHISSEESVDDSSPAVATDSKRLASMRTKLEGKNGRQFWKSFEELAGSDEFHQWVEDEFPNRKSLLDIDRRQFLTLSGAALAMAGLSGCRFLPQSKAVPYVRSPEELIPSKKLVYASVMPSRYGYGLGVLVESHEGRPTKIEGNPRHPSSLGATDVWGQAETLELYDPDRSQSVVFRGEISTWDEFLSSMGRELSTRLGGRGAGISLLTETVISPVMGAQIRQFLTQYPSAKWHQYDPINRDGSTEGTRLAFGQPVTPVYRLQNARVILSLDSDFLLTAPGNVRVASDFATGRRVRKGTTTMNRLYVIESSYTITGAMADHRLAAKPSQIEEVARALYARIVGGGAGTGSLDDRFLDALARDLQANTGAAVVVAGEDAPASVHALAHGMNAALGAVGKTVNYTAPIEAQPQNQLASLTELVGDINAGRVGALFILGGNPVYNAPRDFNFAKLLTDKVKFRVHLSRYADETSDYCDWHLPESHPLEAWGDLRSFDGTTSIVQPLIEPLYDTRSAIELLAEMNGQPKPGYDIVRGYYQGLQGGGASIAAGTAGAAGGAAAVTASRASSSGTATDGPSPYQNSPGAPTAAFDRFWEQTLLTGMVANSAAAPLAVTARTGLDAALPAPARSTGDGAMEIVFRPDPSVWDGRYANNSWLQELPKPITTITWDNAAMISPATAKAIGLIASEGQNDMVNIAQATGKRQVAISVPGVQTPLVMAVWILPGLPDNTVTLHLGFGRLKAGNVALGQSGRGVGFDTYALRLSNGFGYTTGTVKPAPGVYEIAVTQPHHALQGEYETKNRDIVRVATFEEFVQKSGEIFEEAHVPHMPEATGFGTREAEHGGGGGEHRPDGSLGGEHNQGGHNQTAETEIIADAYRKQWRYTDKSQSNKEGFPSLYPEFSGKGYNQWGMVVDQNTCIGCNACVIACQAENNIPTVGKDQVGRGREMHWLRIDSYYESTTQLQDPEVHFQPMMCQHCEKAPCEPVCPVAATVHSHEGLNQMVYNRCVGTRYCSNNCPYKVRRYNFLKWTQAAGGPTTLNFVELPVLKMLNNPDVTVRGRGVMEKCTYCVQRINSVRIEAKKEQREIRDGEVITACAQVCPTQAIIFGDINNPQSQVSILKEQTHDYSVLAELNTRPRTSYLARLKNPNPELATAAVTGQEAPKEVRSQGPRGE